MTKKKSIEPLKDVDTYLGLKSPGKKQTPMWQDRTRVLYGTLLFCAFTIGYITWQGKDTSINGTIALGCFALAGSAIGCFTGAKTWHDINVEKIKAVTQVRQTEITGVVPVATDSDEK